MKLLLDTCTILWAVSSPEQLPDRAREALCADDTEVWVSPISCAEIACACERGKISLDRHWRLWCRHFIELNQWRIADIGLAVIEEAYCLPPPFHRDPADRMIVATARLLNCPIVSADKKILSYPHVQTIWS